MRFEMAFPLRDENPVKGKPVLTISLIVLNSAIFLGCLLSGSFVQVVESYGMVPREIVRGQRLYTLITSMFLHGGYLHIIGNMWYLWIFGDNIEDACGRLRFLLLYFAGGLMASLAHILSDPSSPIPTIGASGAISSVLGAYLVLYPKANVLTLVTAFFIWHLVKIPAIAFLGFWFLLQVLSASVLLVARIPSTVAYWAHIGGFLAGAGLVLLLRRHPKRRRMTFGYAWGSTRLKMLPRRWS
ncbi:MAG: rhomboid family intramembrane serine protease [Hadesarchaea archaeon]|nr:rhomboid family intramembrane serine protease [Hadesarchaea archaeon]